MFARISDTVCHRRTAPPSAAAIQLSFLSAYIGKPKTSVCPGCSSIPSFRGACDEESMMFFHIKGKSSCRILASFGFGLTMFARISDTVCQLRTAALFAAAIQLSFLSAYIGKPKTSVCIGCSF